MLRQNSQSRGVCKRRQQLTPGDSFDTRSHTYFSCFPRAQVCDKSSRPTPTSHQRCCGRISPIPEGTFSTQPILYPSPTTESTQSSTPIPEGIPKVGASSSQQFTEIATPSHTRNLEEEEVVELTDSKDKFEVFNQDLSLETSVTNLDPHFSPIINEMGI